MNSICRPSSTSLATMSEPLLVSTITDALARADGPDQLSFGIANRRSAGARKLLALGNGCAIVHHPLPTTARLCAVSPWICAMRKASTARSMRICGSRKELEHVLVDDGAGVISRAGPGMRRSLLTPGSRLDVGPMAADPG